MQRQFTIIMLALSVIIAAPSQIAAQQKTSSATIQQPTTEQTAKIKQQLEGFKLDTKVTIDLFDGRRFFGTLKSIEATEILLADYDTKQLVTLRYDQVKKVRKGISGINATTGRRTPGSCAVTITAIAVGAVLVILVIISVASLGKS